MICIMLTRLRLKYRTFADAVTWERLLRRLGEGAFTMIRTKGEAGTGNVVEAVRHMRQFNNDIHQVQVAPVQRL